MPHLSEGEQRLGRLEGDWQMSVHMLKLLAIDKAHYDRQLRYEVDGAKSNPLRLHAVASTDQDVLGKWLIHKYKHHRSGPNWSSKPQLIGSLYGFLCYIDVRVNPGGPNRYLNIFFLQSPLTGLVYGYNNGVPNLVHARLTARYFLNSIDRVGNWIARYERGKAQAEKWLPAARIMAQLELQKVVPGRNENAARGRKNGPEQLDIFAARVNGKKKEVAKKALGRAGQTKTEHTSAVPSRQAEHRRQGKRR